MSPTHAATDRPRVPLIILGGSDRRPPTLPDQVEGLHPLSGFKGVDITIGGRPLIDLLLERVEQSGLFGPLFLAGPRRVYGERRGPAEVIDTDGAFGENIRAALEHFRRVLPGSVVAFSSCDILPEVGELHRLMDDYHRHAPLDFWFPLILAPERTRSLGASAWKPEYRVALSPGAEPELLLPGHLGVCDPESLRLPLIYSSFDLGYRTRNRPVLYRLVAIVSGVVGALLYQDLRHLLGLRLPTLTTTVIFNATVLALKLRRGAIDNNEVALRLHRIFVRHRHRRRYPDRTARVPLLDGLSLAKDIDTAEEAEEMARRLE